jgi:hypothetical protein
VIFIILSYSAWLPSHTSTESGLIREAASSTHFLSPACFTSSNFMGNSSFGTVIYSEGNRKTEKMQEAGNRETPLLFFLTALPFRVILKMVRIVTAPGITCFLVSKDGERVMYDQYP